MRGNLVGKKFGRLMVMSLAHGGPHRRADCVCDCGQSKSVRTDHLISGATQSCGCWHDEAALKNNLKHGYTKTPEYSAWQGMRFRCHNPRNKKWNDYGGRGIIVCEEWRNSFESFLAHVGDRPNGTTSLDRIDVNGNYEPGNVRWATATVQARNTRLRKTIRIGDQEKTLAEWTDISERSRGNIFSRIKAGWTPHDAVFGPLTPRKLSLAVARQIRSRVLAGEPRTKLAKEFSVDISTIRHIVNGKTWKETNERRSDSVT